MERLTNRLVKISGKIFQSKPWLIILFSRFHKLVFLYSKGRILGTLGELPVMILHTEGRKTGKVIKTVLVYYFNQEKYFIVASFGGNPKHPSWYFNLKKNPNIRVQLKTEIFNCYARTISKEEKSFIWPEIVNFYSGYESYQNSTGREIPVVELQLR